MQRMKVFFNCSGNPAAVLHFFSNVEYFPKRLIWTMWSTVCSHSLYSSHHLFTDKSDTLVCNCFSGSCSSPLSLLEDTSLPFSLLVFRKKQVQLCQWLFLFPRVWIMVQMMEINEIIRLEVTSFSLSVLPQVRSIASMPVLTDISLI